MRIHNCKGKNLETDFSLCFYISIHASRSTHLFLWRFYIFLPLSAKINTKMRVSTSASSNGSQTTDDHFKKNKGEHNKEKRLLSLFFPFFFFLIKVKVDGFRHIIIWERVLD